MRREILCAHCGVLGKIEITGLNDDSQPCSLFNYFGYNPLSGHMLFQCPVCETICLASPMAVLGDDLIIAQPCSSAATGEKWASFISGVKGYFTKLVLIRPECQKL